MPNCSLNEKDGIKTDPDAQNFSLPIDTGLRVAVCQPSLPHYRIPFFRALAAQSGIQSVTVFCDQTRDGMHSVADDAVTVVEGDIARRSFPPGCMTQSAMLQVLDPKRFDVAVLSWNVRYVTLPRALVKARRRGFPVLLWGHGASKAPGVVSDMLRRSYGQLAAGVILYDNRTAAELMTRRGFNRDNVFVAQNALDQTPVKSAMRLWQRDVSRLRQFQHEHELDPSQTFILVSRLLPENSGDLLLELMRRLRDKFPHAKLVIVGDGNDRPRLQNLTRQYQISNSVIFTGAIYDENKLAPWMLSSTALVYPGNMGLSLLHAFGYGLPVITGDRKQGHGPEIHALHHGKNGLFFRNMDVGDLQTQCQKLMASAELRRRMSAAAMETVTTDYTLQKMVDGFAAGLRLATGPRTTGWLPRAA